MIKQKTIGLAGIWVLAGALLILVSGISRPLFPLDETRYMGVAWEMWQQHHFLFPLLNGLPYTQKPPVFFWLNHLGWWAFGVNEWWPRVFPGLFGIGTLFMTQQLARYLWPQHKQNHIGFIAPMMLLGMSFFAYYLPRSRLDIILGFFIALGWYGLCVSHSKPLRGWLYFLLGLTLATLTKGPISFLFLLPAALLGFIKMPTNKQHQANLIKWYTQLLVTILMAIAITSLWLWLVKQHSSASYTHSLAWQQIIKNLTQANANHHWVYYLVQVPLLICPWFLWGGTWRALFKYRPEWDWGLWFCMVTTLVCLMGLCIIAPKANRYVIPLLPLFALLIARLTIHLKKFTRYDAYPLAIILLAVGIGFFALPWIIPTLKHSSWLSQISPWWGLMLIIPAIFLFYYQPQSLLHAISSISFCSMLLVVAYYLGWIQPGYHYYDLKPTAVRIHHYQAQHKPVAFEVLYRNHRHLSIIGSYDDEFQFLGRLTQPLQIVTFNTLVAWAKQHPNGFVVQIVEKKPYINYAGTPLYQQPFRARGRVRIWSAKQIH